MKGEFAIRKAKVKDVKEIHALIEKCARREELLPRSLSEVYENVRDFWVAEKKGRGEIIGCSALSMSMVDLAEIRSLAIAEGERSKGVGTSLLKACIKEAKSLGIPRVFALTYTSEFFKKHGFKLVDKSILPHKIWNECIKCARFPDCGEVAVVYKVKKSERGTGG